MNKHERKRFAGMEIFEITPVILGGSSTDPKNKAVLNRKQHIAAVRYWNKIIADIKQPLTGQP
jgi:hypothetical protein